MMNRKQTHPLNQHTVHHSCNLAAPHSPAQKVDHQDKRDAESRTVVSQKKQKRKTREKKFTQESDNRQLRPIDITPPLLFGPVTATITLQNVPSKRTSFFFFFFFFFFLLFFFFSFPIRLGPSK